MLGYISLAASVVGLILGIVSGTSAPDSSIGDWAAGGGMLLAILGAILGAIALIRKQGPKWASITGLAVGAIIVIGVFLAVLL